MKANLERIPDDDAGAVKTLARVGALVDERFLSTLDKSARRALGRYGARSPSLALRRQSPDLLRAGLLAASIAEVVTPGDVRDRMVGYALFFDAGQRLGLAPAELFNAVATRFANPEVAAAPLTLATGTMSHWKHSGGRLSRHQVDSITSPTDVAMCR